MAGPGRAARGRLTEPPCWPRAALRRFLPQCPAPRGGDRRWRRGRAGPRRTSGRRFRSPPSAAASGFRRAAPHFRSGPPPLSPRDFRPLLNTSGCSHPLFRSETSCPSVLTSGPSLLQSHGGTSGRCSTLPVHPSSRVTAGLESPVHTSGLPLPVSPRDFGLRSTLPVLPSLPEAFAAPRCGPPIPSESFRPELPVPPLHFWAPLGIPTGTSAQPRSHTSGSPSERVKVGQRSAPPLPPPTV